MQNSAFKNIEDSLRMFLGRVCVELTESDDKFLAKALPHRHKPINKLELQEYCTLLINNSDGYRDWNRDTCTLFERYDLPKSVVSDLVFVKSLRNKYVHQEGLDSLHSNDQLADLLIVQRAVTSLSSHCKLNEEFQQLSKRIDGLVKDLVIQVAMVNDPDQFDTDGEAQVLSDSDRDFLAEKIEEAVRSTISATQTASIEKPEATNIIDATSGKLHDLHLLLSRMEKKLAPIKSLKGRIDEIEQTMRSNAADLQTQIRSLHDDFRERDNPSALDEDSDDYEYGDEIDETIEENLGRLNDLKHALDELKSTISQLTIPPINSWQARDELINLRRRIWKETQSGPSADGLLRKSMIDEFLHYRPASEEEAFEEMSQLLRSVSDEQLCYLDDVCAILRRIENE